MVRTTTPEKITVTKTNEEEKELSSNNAYEPSEQSIMNILNYSKALKPLKGKQSGIVLKVMN